MKITAVGGYKAVGRNMTGVSVGKETVAIDNGIRLDTLQMYDDEKLEKLKKEDLVDLDVIPEMSRLKNVIAQVISHGHLDHIGALPFTRPNVPIITTPYATEIGRKEFKDGDFYSLNYDEKYRISKNITVEFIEVTHSIPQSSIVVLHTSEGKIVYAADYKFDNHSNIAKVDYKKLREIGRSGVKLLIAESTRVRETGKTPSEKIVKSKLKDVFEFIEDGLIVATTFSSHIERIQAILEEIEKTGRTPLIIGTSLLNQITIAERFDLIDMPPTARFYAKENAINNALKNIKNRDAYFLLVTGHQAEPDSALVRLANNKFRFRFQKNDSVLFCANTIPVPVNEANRSILKAKLQSRGVRIFEDLHVSGHAAKEDHRVLINMLKPEHIVPCHGTMDMRSSYSVLASEEGYELNKNVHLINNGQSIEL